MTHLEANKFLEILEGKQLRKIKRISDVASFNFGEDIKIISKKGKEIIKGAYGMHLNFPWRLVDEKNDTTLIASHDIYVPNSIIDAIKEWDPNFDWEQKGNNMFDEKLEGWKNKYQEIAKIYVEKITVNLWGDLKVKFSNNTILETFTNTATKRELWRFFECKNMKKNLIVTGEKVINNLNFEE